MTPPGGSFLIPHSISVDEGRKRIYVADRENGRLQSFDFSGKLLSVWEKAEFAPKLFAVAYHKDSGKHTIVCAFFPVAQ
jgi:DNA-binding beta-propeller fold protein YncE